MDNYKKFIEAIKSSYKSEPVKKNKCTCPNCRIVHKVIDVLDRIVMEEMKDGGDLKPILDMYFSQFGTNLSKLYDEREEAISIRGNTIKDMQLILISYVVASMNERILTNIIDKIEGGNKNDNTNG